MVIDTLRERLSAFEAHERARLCEEDNEAWQRAVQMLRCHRPLSNPLVSTAAQGQCLRKGLGSDALADLERRLGTPLPPSYRSFLQASNGLFAPGFVSLLPAEDVAPFAKLDPESVRGWCTNAIEASDAQYATYGPEQDCIHLRTRHLWTALQVSTEIDGDVVLLVPEVRFGDEWEAWFLGAKNPGAYRYRSFAELLETYWLDLG